jgi:SAM-dependent methyltransferase
MKDDKTRQTYDQHAAEIAERFWGVELTRSWEAFLSALTPQARIIDIGCGAGRDVYHFIGQGASAFGLDTSAGLLGEAVKRGAPVFAQADMRALPLAPTAFDGAWLCASLLHLPREAVPGILRGVHRCLKPGGMLYISLKKGTGEGWETREGPRFFSYYSTSEIEQMVTQAGFALRQTWLDPAKEHTWINLLAERQP